MTATYGQTLADIALPVNWEWENAEQSVGNAGTRTAFAVFTPEDTQNYNSVRVQIAYSVEKAHYDMSGVKFEDAEYTYDGQEKKLYIYNVCDHQECYREVGSQAVAYTTGVPAMIGAMLVMNGQWKKPGVYNVEEFDPDPFMDALNKWGLPWKISENPDLVE